MTPDDHSPPLRREAEAQLARAAEPPLDALVHELRVHQIELEMQNEALRQTTLALEESRDRYVDLYEFAPIGYLTLSPEGIIVDLNLTATRLLGQVRESLLRRSFGAFVLPDDGPCWLDHLAGLPAGAPAQVELRLLRGDGTHFWAQLDSAPTREGMRLGLSDITPRKRVEAQLRAATAEAQRANEAKSRFLAAASHDLRQPLTALRLYTGALAGKVAAADRKLVADIDDCVADLSSLLSDLLDLSKLDAGVVKPKRGDFPVFDLLASLESVFIPKARAKGLSLRFAATRLTGHTDPVLFKRILGNIIDNAIHYTAQGGVVVGCRCRDGKRWVEVRDSGIGIAAEHIPEIFEDFRQLGDGARSRGSGLGLAIVARTAALLGLAVRVHSRPGGGSVFAVELPLGLPAAPPAPEPLPPRGRRLRIALVEDNALVRTAMVFALQDKGHQVVARESGAALLAELGRQAPDIVLADYRLAGGETGFDVITALRKAFGGALAALVVTGDTDPKVIAGMLERGVVVMHKPVDMGKLCAALEDLTAP